MFSTLKKLIFVNLICNLAVLIANLMKDLLYIKFCCLELIK